MCLDIAAPARKLCWCDHSRLKAMLLPKHLVQLKRRFREINAIHPQYREETPLVLACKTKRRP